MAATTAASSPATDSKPLLRAAANASDASSGHEEPTKTAFGPATKSAKSSCGSPQIDELAEAFSWKFLVGLVGTYIAYTGIIHSWLYKGLPYLLKDYPEVDAREASMYKGIIDVPFSVVPILGLLATCMPIFGYRLWPMLLSTTTLGILGLAVLGSSTMSSIGPAGIVSCCLAINLMISTGMLAGATAIAKKVQLRPELAPSLAVFTSLGKWGADVVSTFAYGPIYEAFGAQFPYLIAACCIVPSIYVAAFNFLEEEPVPHGDTMEARNTLTTSPGYAVSMLAAVTSLASMFTALGSWYLMDSATYQLVVSLAMLTVLALAANLLLRPEIARPMMFLTIQNALWVDVLDAEFYYMTDSPVEFADGPHFSPFFYTSIVSTCAAMGGMAMVLLYNRYMKSWSFRGVAALAILMASLSYLPKIAILTNWYRMSGFALAPWFIILPAMRASALGLWMAQQLLIGTKLTTDAQGLAAPVMAVWLSAVYLGDQVKDYGGSVVLGMFHVEPTGVSSDAETFVNLPYVNIVVAILPLLALPLIRMLPEGLQTDKIEGQDGEEVTKDSILNRWQAARSAAADEAARIPSGGGSGSDGSQNVAGAGRAAPPSDDVFLVGGPKKTGAALPR